MPAARTIANNEDIQGQLDQPDDASVVSALATIDWNFPARTSHSDIEGLHPYPAKFVAELPGAILDTLAAQPGSYVFDPFCGSGTTLVECQRRGIPSVGVDLNPIACLISRVKTAPLPDGILSGLNAVLTSAQLANDVVIPHIPNLDHWFLKPVQTALASLATSIGSVNPKYVDIFRLALSSIIVRVSNQESDTRYAAVSKNVGAKDVYFAFKRATERVVDALAHRDYRLGPAQIIEADTVAMSPERVPKGISLVVTSPPYPNAYEYWLYHKYRMWWLGFDPIAVKNREIGARAHFFKRNHHTGEDFRHQMAATFRLLKSVLRARAHVCFIVGRSRIHGAIFDNAAVIEAVAKEVGFERLFTTERILSPHRKSFNLSHANIKTETIIILRLQ
jgi:site-specific DNA-methyltransferase (cytosine-N4-specific)